jgi:hypothetical protein
MWKLNVLRLQLKSPVYTDGKVHEMYYVLKRQNISDKKVREYHIEKIKEKVIKDQSSNG